MRENKKKGAFSVKVFDKSAVKVPGFAKHFKKSTKSRRFLTGSNKTAFPGFARHFKKSAKTDGFSAGNGKAALLGFAKWAAFGAVITYLFYKLWWLSLIAAIAAGCFGIPREKKRKHNRQCREINDQFREGLQGMATALNAGYAMENAIGEARKDLILLYGKDSLLAGEFLWMQQQMELNQPVEKVFLEFSKKWETEDIAYFVQVFQTAKRTGSDLISIIRLTANKIGEKAQVKREIETMVAGKKMEGMIMNIIPLGMIAYFWVSSPGFLDCMYESTGRLVMTVLLAMYVAAYLWSEKICDIQV